MILPEGKLIKYRERVITEGTEIITMFIEVVGPTDTHRGRTEIITVFIEVVGPTDTQRGRTEIITVFIVVVGPTDTH